MIERIRRVVGQSAAVFLAAGATAMPAQALSMPFADDFDGIAATALNTAPAGWTASSGTVDSILNGDHSLTCHGGSGGCVDLDGTSGDAGTLLTSGTFALEAGTTYQLTAWVSGNQRTSLGPPLNAPDSLLFGFRDGSGPIAGATSFISSIASSQPFTLISLLFTPSSDVSASIFFEAGGGDNVGPLLDDVALSAVPLPAAGWLLLGGLAALGAFGRRRTAAAGSPPLIA